MSANQNKTWWCFLDRDGVIVKDHGHVHKIEDLEILPNAIEGLLQLKDLGFRFLIVTNQAGIAKNYYTYEDALACNEELCRRLAQKNILIEATYMCPHHPEYTGECLCRKPKVGMLDRAARDFSIKPSQSILVGDKDSDIEAGKRWGCRTFRINNNQYPVTVAANYNVGDLLQVAEVMKKSSYRPAN